MKKLKQVQVKSDEFKTFDQNDIYDIGVKSYFDLDNIKSYDKKSDKTYRTHPEEYNSYITYNNAVRNLEDLSIGQFVSLPKALGGRQKVTQELIDNITATRDKKQREFQSEFENEQAYEEYLKETLGDKYEAYKQYQEDPNSVKLPQKFIDGAKKQLYREKLNRYFRSNVAKGIDDTLVQEAIKYLNFSDVSETKKTFESTRDAIEEEDEEQLLRTSSALSTVS